MPQGTAIHSFIQQVLGAEAARASKGDVVQAARTPWGATWSAAALGPGGRPVGRVRKGKPRGASQTGA